MEQHEKDERRGDKIDTGGGSAVQGDANVGRDFTGRDKANVNVNVYNKPDTPVPKKPRARRLRKTSSSMADAFLYDRVMTIVNEHSVKLAKLEMYREADQQTNREYRQDLEKDMSKLKDEFQPLRASGLLAQTLSSTEDKEAKERAEKQNRIVVRLLAIIAGSFGLGVGLLIIFLIWLAVNSGV